MTPSAVEQAHREHWSRLLALLVGQLRSFDLAEEALADAFAEASQRWMVEDMPANPAAWLLTVARRKAIDRMRREAALYRRLPLLMTDEHELGPEELVEEAAMVGIPDERLRLIFTCCHPALPMPSRVALTLRLLGGLSTPEIARLFLASEATMAARITRAKKKIAAAGIPYRVPAGSELPERLSGVLTVLYLVFTEGYEASSGPGPVRADLADEAIRLTRTMAELMPDEADVRALLALQLLQHSRRDARTDAAGELVLLADQDRTRWHADEVAEALRWLDTVPARWVSSFALQARIAAEHARAGSAQDTDWAAIGRWYSMLEDLTGSPVVRLNRAVAVAETHGAAAGLSLINDLEPALATDHLFYAARADLLRRLQRGDEARADYRRALELAGTDADRRFLRTRLEAL
jgi:RNA polymerase sigma-70 factor (ECF subfamily)